jgi:hypothetical protein
LGNFKTTAILFEGVRSIADGNYDEETGVFQRCRMLENFTTSIRFVEIPSDLNSFYIGDCAFANDTLKFTIDFPSAPPAITIGNYAFE